MATGCLSDRARARRSRASRRFAGTSYHTGHWPHEGVDFTGQRVGVIGTGSSAIQSIPLIAEQAAHLYRLPAHARTSACPRRTRPLDPEYERRVKANYAELPAPGPRVARRLRDRAQRRLGAGGAAPRSGEREYETRWSRGGLGFSATFTDLLTNKEANDTAAEFFRAKIRAIVHDPAVGRGADAHATIRSAPSASASTPATTRRSTATTSRWSTSAKTPIEAITPHGRADARRPSTRSTASSSPPASTP